MSAVRAHQLAYRILSELFADGVTAQNLLLLKRIPELARALPSDGDHDAFAAAHYDALGLGVPPHESVFLDPEGVIGGVVSRSVVDTYRDIGFEYDLTNVAPDHISVQLDGLGFACDQSEDEQRKMLDGHLLRWVPSLAFALRPHGLYAEAARMLMQVLLDHRETIDGPIAAHTIEVEPLPLDEKQTSIKDIAEYLCLPVASGLWLSRTDLAELGRSARVPRGFGSRALMLGNLLSSAGDRGVSGDVLLDIETKVGEWRSMFSALPDPLGAAWIARLDSTTAIIGRMRQASQQVA